MKTSKYRYLIPNGITFISLTAGLVSIILSANGRFVPAGGLILASYVLDLFDGFAARRLNAGSEFGLQLDSLVDMVSLGVAPGVLVFSYLQSEGTTGLLVWVCVLMLPLAGAYRLARFNLLPVKTQSRDSIGLTISTGGATPALAVLSDYAARGDLLPDWVFLSGLVLLSMLMVSRIPFPPFGWIFHRRRLAFVLVLSAGFSIIWIGFINAWFVFTSGYLGVSLTRALRFGRRLE